MATCRFCKGEISADATRCPHCTSFLDPQGAQGSHEQVTYIVDKGIITFFKFAAPAFGIFLIVALSFYLFDANRMTQAVNDTYAKSQRLDIDITRAQAELEKRTKDIKEHVAAAEKSAMGAKESLARIQASEAKAHEGEIYIATLVATGKRATVSSVEPNPTQVERLVEAKLLEDMHEVLSVDQYTKLQAVINQKKKPGFRRLIYDARNRSTIPGNLARSEGDGPTGDAVVNEVYDNLQVVHDFFKDVFGREIGDDAGGSVIATVHYDKDYDNASWNSQQIVIGDGDGDIFKRYAFGTVQALAYEMAHAMIQRTSGLSFENQSGAINYSFSDVVSVLIQQWQKKQTAEKGDWLVLPGVLGPKAAAEINALRSLKDPSSSRLLTPQTSNIKDYREGDDVFIASGIPNKAFYEFAMRLRGNAWERPAKLWYEAVITLNKDSTFQDFADATFVIAKGQYGQKSAEYEALTQSWAVVGISTPGQKN